MSYPGQLKVKQMVPKAEVREALISFLSASATALIWSSNTAHVPQTCIWSHLLSGWSMWGFWWHYSRRPGLEPLDELGYTDSQSQLNYVHDGCGFHFRFSPVHGLDFGWDLVRGSDLDINFTHNIAQIEEKSYAYLQVQSLFSKSSHISVICVGSLWLRSTKANS